jgi:hypothetical protein
MIMVTLFPKVWFEIMDPLVSEYRKHSMGRIKTELTEKSLSLTRQFTIKMAIFIAIIWSLTPSNSDSHEKSFIILHLFIESNALQTLYILRFIYMGEAIFSISLDDSYMLCFFECDSFQ